MNSPTPQITTAIPIVYEFRRSFVLVVAKEKQEQKQSELTITEFSQRWLREHRVKIKESTYVNMTLFYKNTYYHISGNPR